MKKENQRNPNLLYFCHSIKNYIITKFISLPEGNPFFCQSNSWTVTASLPKMKKEMKKNFGFILWADKVNWPP